MGNTYFQFKKFTIHQDACAMKVCTDACLFGAWAADKILAEKKSVTNILDIGSGTGLLSMMMGQKINAKIQGVETEQACVTQSRDNALTADFPIDVEFFNQRIQDFVPGSTYDFIISNPPFYENDLTSPHEKINLARHDKGLLLKELAACINRLLSQNGSGAILLPYARANEFVQMMKEYLFVPARVVIVHHSPGKIPFRSMIIFSRSGAATTKESIYIKTEEGEYSKEFKRLLQPYYLQL